MKKAIGLAIAAGVVAVSLAGVGAIVALRGTTTAAPILTTESVTSTSTAAASTTDASAGATPATEPSANEPSATATSTERPPPPATRTPTTGTPTTKTPTPGPTTTGSPAAEPTGWQPSTSTGSADARTSKTVKASFATLQRSLNGPAGVVVFRVGATGKQGPLLEVGELRTGVAWSTSKVPVTVAALKRSSSTTTKSRARAAITRSANAAAEKLWSGLGKPTTAAKRTQAVIRVAGDSTTKIESRRVRAGFTAFGQTTWTMVDQARFAAGLTCRTEAKATVTLMRAITPSQAFGVGTIKRNTAYKGGWGPVSGGYLVRQMAVITMPDGASFGVAIGVRSRDGYTRGTKDLTRIATWLSPQLSRLDGGTCPKKP